MNTNLIRTLIAASFFAAAAPVLAQEAEKPVAVKTDGLPGHVRARIEAKAQEGPTALIRYINSTRHIHNLRVEMVVVPEETAPAQNVSKEQKKVADRK